MTNRYLLGLFIGAATLFTAPKLAAQSRGNKTSFQDGKQRIGLAADFLHGAYAFDTAYKADDTYMLVFKHGDNEIHHYARDKNHIIERSDLIRSDWTTITETKQGDVVAKTVMVEFDKTGKAMHAFVLPPSGSQDINPEQANQQIWQAFNGKATNLKPAVQAKSAAYAVPSMANDLVKVLGDKQLADEWQSKSFPIVNAKQTNGLYEFMYQGPTHADGSFVTGRLEVENSAPNGHPDQRLDPHDDYTLQIDQHKGTGSSIDIQSFRIVKEGITTTGTISQNGIVEKTYVVFDRGPNPDEDVEGLKNIKTAINNIFQPAKR